MFEKFVHLRLHTEYSIIDGLVRIDELTSRVAKMGMPAVVISDHVNLFGLIKFYSAAMIAGVKPLCGCDILVENEENPQRPTPLVLLVKNLHGYRNLTELISRAYTERTTGSELTVKRDWVRQHADGLIALSGGRFGEIGRTLLEAGQEKAAELLAQWMQWFPDSFYLELQRCGRDGEENYIAEAVRLATACACPVVATNDVRFLNAEDFEAHEVRVCINERRTLDDPRRSHHYTEQQYLRSAAEMQELFSDIPEAIENTLAIAMRCNLELELVQNGLDPLKLGVLGQGEGHLLLRHFQLLAHARDVAHNPISERHELLNGLLQLLAAWRRLSNGVGRDRIKTGAGHGGSSLACSSLLASSPSNANPCEHRPPIRNKK